jgi:hypothetical protein
VAATAQDIGTSIGEFILGVASSIAGVVHAIINTGMDPIDQWFIDFFFGIENAIAGFVNGMVDGLGTIGDVLGTLFDRWGGSEFTVKEPKPAGSMAARTTPTTAPVAAYYAPGAGGVQGAGGKAAPVTKTVNVNAGDTVINVNGAGDPAAVAQRVQTRNALSWDNVLNSAANTAGGL